MNDQQSQGPGSQLDGKVLFNLAYWFFSMWAASVEVWLRHSFGVRYLGLQAAAVLLWIPMYAAFWEDGSAWPLLPYLLLYGLLCFVHRMHGMVRWWKGEREHTYYSGHPMCRATFRFAGERTVKLVIEPLLVFLIGFLLCPSAPGFGIYFLGAGACLLLKAMLERAKEERILMDTRDAYFMQRTLRERMRDF